MQLTRSSQPFGSVPYRERRLVAVATSLILVSVLILAPSSTWFASAASDVTVINWQLQGNKGTSPATNFLGTTDSEPLVLRTNNVEALRVLPGGNGVGGNVGIGTTSPASPLTVAGTVQSTSGGFKFPDGTTQTTAGVTSVTATAPLGSSGGTTPTVSLSGIVPVANGGAGLATAGSSGSYLRSNGTAWTSTPIASGDLPAGSPNYIQNGTSQQTGASFNIDGNGTIGGTLTCTGCVGTADVASGAVGTAQLAANAATQYQYASSTSYSITTSTTPQPIPGQSVTLTTTGGAVLAMFSATVKGANTGCFEIVRDNAVVLAFNCNDFTVTGGSYVLSTTITLFGVDTPTAGVPHTYTVEWYIDLGAMTMSASGTTANLVAIELKR
jgi:hypothetical protein